MAFLQNPFYFETPTDRDHFTDRETLVPILRAAMEGQGRRLLVYGRRRMGKTSLLAHVGRPLKKRFITCDISTAADLNEVAALLLQAAPKSPTKALGSLVELAGKYLKNITVSAGHIALSGELRLNDGQNTLGGVLNYLNDVAASRKQYWTICLDEFQDIRSLGGPKVDWHLRGLAQKHRHLNYIFTGSDHRLVQWLTEPSAPFFKQLSLVEVGRIAPDHMARWIETRAAQAGMDPFPYADEIVSLTGPCTGDIIRLAKAVFDLAGTEASKHLVGDVFNSISNAELNQEFVARWRPLTMIDRNVLRAIAFHKLPTASDTLRQHGIRSASSAGSAVERLVTSQILVREDGRLQFDNPFFMQWVRTHSSQKRGQTVR